VRLLVSFLGTYSELFKGLPLMFVDEFLRQSDQELHYSG
jgi:hypothetical protein